MHIKVCHIEAGLRSGDMTMPEEINRILTDSITDYFFTTSIDAGHNLKKEGVQEESIFYVGNIMIDSLIDKINFAQKPSIFRTYSLEDKKYYLLTLHRTDNVDNADVLCTINHLLMTAIGHCLRYYYL